MNKIFLLIIILLTLCVGSIYFFIPRDIKIHDSAVAHCIPKNIADCLRNETTWEKWWPGSFNGKMFTYGNYRYNLTEPFTDGAQVELNKGQKNFSTRILVVPSGKDSALVEWQASLAAGYNPIKRIAQWFEAREMKNDMRFLLDTLVNFAGKTENMYGFHIERTTFTDTILVATKFSSTRYPTTEIIFNAIDQLKKKINEEAAQEKDFPMLNIKETDSGHFETMVAICINKEIKNTGSIFMTRMVPMKDRFLKTEVTGGPLMIKSAHEAIEKYMTDHFLSAPAIPFEILVTDRSKEPDTSKWKTNVFYPSM